MYMLNPNDYISISKMLEDCGWTEDQINSQFIRGSDTIPFSKIIGHTPQTFAKSVPEEYLTPPQKKEEAVTLGYQDSLPWIMGNLGYI